MDHISIRNDGGTTYNNNWYNQLICCPSKIISPNFYRNLHVLKIVTKEMPSLKIMIKKNKLLAKDIT